MRTYRKILIGFFVTIFFLIPYSLMAHYGMVIPSDTMIMQEDNRLINLTLSFSHPFESIGMELVKPEAFTVYHSGKTSDLLNSLKNHTVMGKPAFSSDYQIKRPGTYIFYMKPVKYWEEAEDCFIVHHTKTIVASFGMDDEWDHEIGAETEIVPLSKPFGLYTGNVFQGIVKLHGKPVPYSDVEIEYYNQDNTYKAPTDYMVTQTVKTDQNGVFTYAVPTSGWWGFAALNTSDTKADHQGVMKEVEIGAVLWVKFHDMIKN